MEGRNENAQSGFDWNSQFGLIPQLVFFSDSPPLMPEVGLEALDEVMTKKGPSRFPSLNCWSSSLDPSPAGVDLTEMATFTSLSQP